MKIKEWVKTYPAKLYNQKDKVEKVTRFMNMRLKGMTLQEIGEQETERISRERVRQIIAPMMQNKPELDEDRFEALYWFKSYSFLTPEHFKAMFNLDDTVYNYYDMFYRRNLKATRAQFEKDRKLTEDLFNKYKSISQPTLYYRQNNWHEYAMETFKWAFDSNPHGRLTVIDVVKNKNGKAVFKCKCECGNIVEVATNNIERTKSCGCLKKDLQKWVAGTRNRKCRNVDTGEVFDSVEEAGKKYGLARETIYAVCTGRVPTAKGFRWEYVKDESKSVRCVETGEVFSSVSKAQKACGNKNVHAVLKGLAITAGGYHWEYVDPDKNTNIRKA